MTRVSTRQCGFSLGFAGRFEANLGSDVTIVPATPVVLSVVDSCSANAQLDGRAALGGLVMDVMPRDAYARRCPPPSSNGPAHRWPGRLGVGESLDASVSP